MNLYEYLLVLVATAVGGYVYQISKDIPNWYDFTHATYSQIAFLIAIYAYKWLTKNKS